MTRSLGARTITLDDVAGPVRDAAGDLLLCVMLWARPVQEQVGL